MSLLNCVRPSGVLDIQSKQLDKEIKKWIKSYNQSLKLLLLGTGESGKTTIISQMKILHVKGFSREERINKISKIRLNLHEAIYDIVSNMKSLNIRFGDPMNEKLASDIIEIGGQGLEIYSEDYYDSVKKLWLDIGVKECFKHSNEYQLLDSAEYFLNRLDLIARDDYIPTDMDILRCRQKTCGIHKIEFKVKVPKLMNAQEFWMFDVGGQRGERKKWIQVLDGINAVWFIVGCSDFDQTLREDCKQNRLVESLNLFEDVWQSRFLADAGLIVFLNKQDILEQKVSYQNKSISKYFPEYNTFRVDPDEYTNTKLFIKSLFVSLTQKKRTTRPNLPAFKDHNNIVFESLRKRECYYHFTVATDTNNIDKVFRDVHSIILKNVLKQEGLL